MLEANLRAYLLKNPGISESELRQKTVEAVPGVNIDRATRTAISRLRGSARLVGSSSSLTLSETERATMEAAEDEFLSVVNADIDIISEVTELPREEASQLLNLALELLVRNRDLNGIGPSEEALRSFMANRNLNRKRIKIFEALSKCKSAQFKQHGTTIDQIFSANSFDIYRALGRRTDVAMVLDSSVAMPVIFGLEFGAAKSRYGIAALALRDACKAHNIKMVVPRCYLNEMAGHGRKALEKLEIYRSLPEEARTSLRASGNAYLSHYTHISETMSASGENLKLEEFLNHFGVIEGRSLDRIENRISSLLESHGITCIGNGRYDHDVFETISKKKPFEIRLLIEHDATVCSMLKNEDQRGFIFATWDKIVIDIVEDIARVLADTPVRVIDFLSMAAGQNFESDQNFELLSSLLHTDEKIAQKLADKVERINSVEQAYKLSAFIQDARQRGGSSWTLKPEDVAPFLDTQESDELPQPNG